MIFLSRDLKNFFIKVKKKLIESRMFVATYWPNVLNWCTEDMLEHELASKVIAIPIDQRYDVKEMGRIIQILKQNQ